MVAKIVPRESMGPGPLSADYPVIVQHSLKPDSAQQSSSENLQPTPEDYDQREREAFDRTYAELSGLVPPDPTGPRAKAQLESMRSTSAKPRDKA